MKSYAAYFVRNQDVERVRDIFRSVDPVPGTSWLICALSKGVSPPDDDVLWGRASLAEGRSCQLGEVIFVYGDTSTDGFVYEHARDGKLLRKLVWFPMLDEDWTPGWLCALGEPEAWEQALFRPDKLESHLELERERFEEEGRASEYAGHEARVREAWQGRRIEAGARFPGCDGTVALLVERSFGITRAG